MKRKRHCFREGTAESTSTSEIILDLGGLQVTLEADIIDLKDEGAVFITHYPLETGQIVELTNGNKYGSGIVKSSFKKRDDTYRVEMYFHKEEALVCNR